MGFHNGIKFSPAGETPQKPNRGTRRLSENTLLLRPAANPEGLRQQAQNILNVGYSRAASWLETHPKLQYKQTDKSL